MSEVGVWRKALVYLGLVDDEELDETDVVSSVYDESPPPPPPAENPVSIRKLSREEMNSVPRLQPVRNPAATGQVHIVEPASFDDAQEIGDKIREGVPVIVNLQGVDEDLLKRLVAFASGVAYGLDGRIQRLAPKVFLVTPPGVEVSAEDRKRLAERGLFGEF